MLAYFLALLAAGAEPPPPSWQGVWSGAVGTSPVRACLARMRWGGSIGAYYYLSRLRTITLEQAGHSRVWTEGEASAEAPPLPRWTFADIGRDLLTGTWSDGRRTLPFRLTRVASADDTQPCGTDAFNGPRWRPLTVTRARGVQDGVPFTKLSYHPGPAFTDVSLEGFALPGDDAATRRINARLRAAVPGKDADLRDCIAGALNLHGGDGDYQASVAPTLITPRWLGATLDVAYDCGGPHPDNASTSLTFDRITGAQVKLENWLNAAALARETAGGDVLTSVRPALRRVILAHAGAIEADCRETVADEEYWDIGLDRRGLRFTPDLPHVDQACADATLVPWRALAPFLSAAGRAGSASVVGR